MWKHGVSMADALDTVTRSRPIACPTSTFRGQLRTFERELKAAAAASLMREGNVSMETALSAVTCTPLSSASPADAK